MGFLLTGRVFVGIITESRLEGGNFTKLMENYHQKKRKFISKSQENRQVGKKFGFIIINSTNLALGDLN